MALILGIESSCDESAAAVALWAQGKIKIIGQCISSQVDIHARYGGVVPEVAAREHLLSIIPTIDQALNSAGIKSSQAARDIDAIAVTIGPGLISSLLAGTETAKALASVWQKPLIGIHHVAGHIAGAFIDLQHEIEWPAITLTVSGGHTQLILMKDYLDMQIIGDTLDDAAGEAFDKTAKILGLGYPGGPLISSGAQKHREQDNAKTPELPKPMLKSNDNNFSFSGLKTATLYAWQKEINRSENNKNAYCWAIEESIVEVLIKKTIKAAQVNGARTIILAGGVAANATLRDRLEKAAEEIDCIFIMPKLEYTTDNAAMIAAAACLRYEKGLFNQSADIIPQANLKLAL